MSISSVLGTPHRRPFGQINPNTPKDSPSKPPIVLEGLLSPSLAHSVTKIDELLDIAGEERRKRGSTDMKVESGKINGYRKSMSKKPVHTYILPGSAEKDSEEIRKKTPRVTSLNGRAIAVQSSNSPEIRVWTEHGGRLVPVKSIGGNSFASFNGATAKQLLDEYLEERNRPAYPPLSMEAFLQKHALPRVLTY